MLRKLQKVPYLKQLFSRSRVFYSLLASFLLMLLIPVTIALLDYSRYQAILREETLQYQRSLIEQVQATVDERLQAVQLIGVNLSMDTEINAYLANTLLEGSELYLQQYKVIRRLRVFRSALTAAHEILLFSHHNNSIVTSVNAFFPDASETILFEEKYKNPALVAALREPRMYAKFVWLPAKDATRGELFLLQSVPLWSTGITSNGMVAIHMNLSQLFENTGHVASLSEGSIALINEKNQLVYSVGNANELDILLAEMQDSNQSASEWKTIGRQTYMFNQIPSQLNGWRYISLQPEQAYMIKLRGVRNVMMFIVLCALVLGIISAYWLSRRNYLPIQEIVHQLNDSFFGTQQKESQSEFQYIQSSVGAMHQTLKSLEGSLAEEVPRMQENMLLRLFNGLVSDSESYLQAMAHLGLLLPYEKFQLVIMDGVIYPSNSVEEGEMVKVLLRQHLMQTMPDALPYGIVDGGSSHLAMLCNGKAEDFPKLTQVLQSTADFLRLEMSSMVSIVVGNITDDLGALAKEYEDCVRFQNCRIALEETGIVHLVQEKQNQRLYICSDTLKNKISNLIAIGDAEGTLALLKNSYEENFSKGNIEINMARSYFITLVDTIFHAMPLPAEVLYDFWNEHTPVPALTTSTTAHEFQQALTLFVQEACPCILQRRKTKTESFVAEIKDFLQQNYYQSNLSLSSVADYFSITPSYLSTFFKENMNSNFLNYLTEMRIKKARKLLAGTEMSVSDIAIAVGYTSSNSFIRNYKKIEQITPGEYRNSLQTK